MLDSISNMTVTVIIIKFIHTKKSATNQRKPVKYDKISIAQITGKWLFKELLCFNKENTNNSIKIRIWTNGNSKDSRNDL